MSPIQLLGSFLVRFVFIPTALLLLALAAASKNIHPWIVAFVFAVIVINLIFLELGAQSRRIEALEERLDTLRQQIPPEASESTTRN